jgi:predicted  nucleic acid-binding Zn-ribbon protein
MPDFNEQLKVISALRAKHRQADEALYRARVALHRSRRQLDRAVQKRTIVKGDRDQEIAGLRDRIARLNAGLAALRQQALEIQAWFDQSAEQARLIERLNKNLASVEDRIAALRDRIAELQQRNPPPDDQIQLLQAELDQLERVLKDLRESLAKARERQRRQRAEEEAERRKKAQVQEEIDRHREELGSLQGTLAEALQPAFDDAEGLRRRQNELASAAQRLDGDRIGSERDLSAAISGLYREPHPRDALSRLDDQIPFLLFPVRIETIFVPVQAGERLSHTELWVRIYPDNITIHTHEKTLTDREVVAGELYWTELVTAGHLRQAQDARQRAAWRHLVQLFGGQRAAWVARETRPSDWDTVAANGAAQTLPDFLRVADAEFFNTLRAQLSAGTRALLDQAITENDGDAFSRLAETEKWFDRVNAAVRSQITGFPAHDPTKTDGWTRAPRTHVLPDRFVLMLSQTDAAPPREIPGNLIPDTLFLGPDPLAAKAAFQTKDGALKFGGAFDWMSDFDKAVDDGMGFRVRLTDAEAASGFAKLFVLGVYLSADANDSAALVEELIENHQFSPKGFSLVPQGTPTNNTERDGTGYSDNDPYDELAFFTETGPPAFDPANPDPKKSRTDGRLLADALGVDYTPLQTVQHADQTEVLEAYSMGTALFPSTLGYWLRTWMAPAVTEETARQARSFFTRFVSGRGPLPAVRVGNQPYGILLTSDFSRWTYPEGGNALVRAAFYSEETNFLKQLRQLLSKLEKIWDDGVSKLPFVGQPNSDSSQVLMKILGQHPTSVEFFQRIGYSTEYLQNLGNFAKTARYGGELQSLVSSMPSTAQLYLKSLGIEEEIGTIGSMRSLGVLWQHYTTALDNPNLIENKPPSEKDRLSFNYIDWLARALSTDIIVKQDFGGPPPSALLYLMLRNALLLQLHHGAYEWLKGRAEFDEPLERSLKSTTLAGIREGLPTVSKFEVMRARVSVVAANHPLASASVADLIWKGPVTGETEASFVREQKDALLILAEAPTARLERCLVEHIDCCNYRLDAWQTGLFAQRLQSHRAFDPMTNDRQRGIYLGAFGWVENLRPGVKAFISPEALPALLRPHDGQPVLEEDDAVPPGPDRPPGSSRGGFVHAPSLNHASAAALLRNAYLSHATPDAADMFSVNLSSERVRRAEFILEGMRNGQPIEALLGYQFERALHDRTSESAARPDVTVLELNQFILPYRQAFLFEGREVEQTGTGGAAEVIPAYSVVNGLKLGQATLSAANGYGTSGVLSPAEQPNAIQGAAILAEQDNLLNTLDAVKDLLMAENAYQLVRGNFDRVAAVSLAQKDAHIPPELEVTETPRGSEFTFTNRVTLHFADLDPLLPASNPWPKSPLTLRAKAETGMNFWLGSVLGVAPEKVRCEVYWVDPANPATRHDQHSVSLADLQIQPIDFVGSVSISPNDTGGATELETRIAYAYRRDHDVSDHQTVHIEFNPDAAPGESTFGQLFPLARHLRALIGESRALHAQDFLPAAGGKATAIPVNKNNPKGYDPAELRARVQTALDALVSLADALDGASAPTMQLVFINDPDAPADDEPFSGSLGAAFTKLEEAKLTFSDTEKVSVHFLLSDAETLGQKLRAIANFGIGDAFPPQSDLTSPAAKAALLDRAHRVARRLRRGDPKDGVLDRAISLLNAATADKTEEQQTSLLLEAGKALFADTFNWLPKFTCHNEIDLASADAARGQLLKHATDATPGITAEELVDEWLQGLARVRPRMHRWELVRTLAEVSDVSLALRPVQVPYRNKDSWLAVEFPENDPNDPGDPDHPDRPPKRFGISQDTLSIAAHGQSAFQAGTRQCGLLLDDWTEEIPTARENTGIAFRFNQPNAAPPQVLLLAVTPEETGSWKWENLVGTLADTLRRAKRRAIEPEELEKQGSVWNAFAPALVSEFSTLADGDVSLDLMAVQNLAELKHFYVKQVRI